MANRSPARAENASQPGESERVSRQDKRHQRIKLNALKSWLEDPFKYRLQQALGRDDTEESLEILGDEEPFETGFFTGLMLVRETWDAALREFAKAGAIDRNHLDAIIGLSDNDRKALYDRLFETGYKVRCLKGETPEGLFSGLDRQKLSDEVVNMLDRLWDAVGSIENIQAVELLQPGQPAADTGAPKAGLVFDAVPKEGESVVLEGRSMVGFRATAKNNTTVLHVFIAAYPKLKDDNKVKYALLPWLTAEAVASARASDFTLVIHLLGAERAFEFAIEITGDNATGHLRSLADDYVTNTKTSHLPLQAIESLTQRGRAVDDLTFEEIAQWLDDDADKGDSASYKSYDPLINLLEQPLCEDAEAAVKMRYSELVKACYPANPARGGA